MTLCISSVALALLAVVPPLDKLHYGCNMTGHSVSVSTEFFFFLQCFYIENCGPAHKKSFLAELSPMK